MDLRRRVEAIMTGKASQAPLWLKGGLTFLSVLYRCAVALRRQAFATGLIQERTLPCVVISIGNIVLGGTGKTPLVVYLAEVIRQSGYSVVVISRGYGGSAESSGGIVGDGRRTRMRADECGDEPYMMAQRLGTIPVMVGKNRYRSGLTAVRMFRPDVILLDDAFQHRRLARDLDLVLLDAGMPLGNGHLFPRGILREPATALKRGHAVIFTRAEGHPHEKRLPSYLASKPVFYSDHRPKLVKIISGKPCSGEESSGAPLDKGLDFLKGKHVLAFAGIARNEDFFNMIQRLGCRLFKAVPFSDHHRYSRGDLEHIRQTAANGHADCLVTTEKDYYRISLPVEWPCVLVVMGVDLVFHDKGFDTFILERVAAFRSEKA